MSGQTDKGAVKAAVITGVFGVIASIAAALIGFRGGQGSTTDSYRLLYEELSSKFIAVSQENDDLKARATTGSNSKTTDIGTEKTNNHGESTSDMKYLLETNPLRSDGWRVNDNTPINTRDQELANGTSYVVLTGRGGYVVASGFYYSYAEYPVDKAYNQLHFQIAPHESFRSEPDKQASLKVSVKRINSEMMETVYPSIDHKKDVFNASSSKLARDIDLGNDVEYLRIEVEEGSCGYLLLWDLVLSNK